MNWRSPVVLSVLVIVSLLLIGVGAYFAITRSQPGPQPGNAAISTQSSELVASPSPAAVRWEVPTGTVPNSDQQAIISAVSTAQASSSIPNDTLLTVTAGKLENDWVVLDAETQVKGSVEVQPSDGLLLVGHKKQGVWEVAIEGGNNFCQLLQEIPSTLLDQDTKDYYIGCSQSQ